MRAGRNYVGMSDPDRNAGFGRRWAKPRLDHDLKDIGDLVRQVAEETARLAIQHWLRQAEDIEGEDRTGALATADEIRGNIGHHRPDLFERRVAR